MADVVRVVALLLGVFVICVALWSAVDQFRRWRRGDRRALSLCLRGLGSALGCIFILAEVVQHFGNSTLTYRTPLAIAVFSLVVIAIIGTSPRAE